MNNLTLYDFALNETQKKLNNSTKEKTLLFVGSKSVGKSSLIYTLLQNDGKIKESLALEYTFCRPSPKNTVKDICHIWELGGGMSYLNLLNIPLTASTTNLEELTIILMLDLSDLNHLWFTMETLLDSIKKLLILHYSNQIKDLENKVWERIGQYNQDKQFLNPFPLKLIIFGGKYDLFKDIDANKKKILCKTLRCAAHIYGASLQFYSSQDSSLVRKAKDLLYHQTFDGIAGNVICQDYNQPLVIPAGFDSLLSIDNEINIENINPETFLNKWKDILSFHFSQQVIENAIEQEDPSGHNTFKEKEIDLLRNQKRVVVLNYIMKTSS